MRLWTLHPEYLDAKGLVALWRESLLAQAVLAGETRGYRHHPQLERFQRVARPRAAIAAYLRAVHDESQARAYRFDRSKIARRVFAGRLVATRGQLEYEWEHLMAKLRLRDPERLRRLESVTRPAAHPLFTIRPGPVARWEVQP